MLDDPDYLRSRARDCLNVAKSIRSDVDKTMLEDIAAELSLQAEKIQPRRRTSFRLTIVPD